MSRRIIASGALDDGRRLEAVLAAGLAERLRTTVSVGVQQEMPLQPGGNGVPSEVASLLDELPEELRKKIYEDAGLSCKEIARLCGLNREFRNICRGPASEAYWQWQCRRLGYDRFVDIQLVGPSPDQPPGGGLWREYYQWHCTNADVILNIANVARTNSDRSALVIAIGFGLTPLVLGLISAGLQPGDFTDGSSNRVTALMKAVELNNMRVTQALLAAGADPDRVDSFGNTALDLAFDSEADLDDMVMLLIDVTDLSGQHFSAIFADFVERAARTGLLYYKNVMKKMLIRGVDPNAQAVDGRPVLWRSILGFGEFALNFFLEEDDIYSATSEIVEELLARGADANSTISGETVLMYASKNRYGGIVSQLLRAGADVNARDNNGLTALGRALFMWHSSTASIVQVLRDAGGVE